MAGKEIFITSTNNGPQMTQVNVRGMNIDFYHGSDSHISPVEYTLAALAGCINGVGYRVAKDMNFELKGIQVSISSSIDTSRLMGEKTSQRAGLIEVNVNIRPVADADEQILKTWLKNVEFRCPMNDIISNPTPVKTKLVLD